MDRGADIRKSLFSLAARGIKYDLDRMVRAAAACGDPHLNCPVFHIAGTNGKGSTCAFLESALRHYGVKTGLFTSPHLVRFEERFAINGAPIDEAVWIPVYDDLQPIIEEHCLTFFEASALIAFEIFRRGKVEWAVIETGLGGRLDATNIVVPAVSIVTRIAMDHMDLLGNDIVAIAGEKLGIVKKRVPLVMAAPDDARIAALARRRCAEMNAPCTFVDAAEAGEFRTSENGAEFTWSGRRYRIPLAGAYQVQNARIALTALETASFRDQDRNNAGLARVRIAGRFQVEEKNGRTLVFDVGHNPDAATEFCQELQKRFAGQAICCVLGIMKDKEIAAMMPRYATIARRIICTAPKTSRAAGGETLQNSIPGWFAGQRCVSPDIPAALESALNGSENIICVAGSFYTVGEAMQFLGITPV